MGVSKMLTYLKTNEDCIEYVDLVQVATDRPGGIKILVDFYAWEYFIQTKFRSCIESKTNNPYLILYGGEYRLIRDYVISFVKALRDVEIEPIFFMDGAKGSSDKGCARKWKTWIRRQTEDSRTMRKMLKLLTGKTPYKSFNIQNVTRPCLQEVQNIITLRKLGCEMQTVLSGEADTFIAKYLLQDKGTVAVFTNDTDFCIFPGSVFLSDYYFDMKNDLEMDDPSLTVKKPARLICGLIKSDQLCRHFHFSDVRSLCELAILAGNDFTLPILRKIGQWGYYIGRISKVAELVRRLGTVEKFQRFHSFMVCESELHSAVQHSREFYSLSLPDDKDEHTNDLTRSIISKAINEIRYPGTIFAMYKKFYWHRTILEDTKQSNSTAECSMVHLRSHLYSMVLPPDQDTVMEYGRTRETDFVPMTVYKITQILLPSLPVVEENCSTKNREVFHNIMSHQENSIPDFENSYFHLYGSKIGFTCYILRYFLLLNWEQNLHITAEEFLLVCAWLLSDHDPEKYISFVIRPSSRCITIENWMLCLFRTSYAFIGNILNLTHEFPVPADLFSGAVWINLYTASDHSPENQEEYAGTCPKLPTDHIRSVNANVESIVNENKCIIETVVKDLFPIRI